MFLLDPSQPAMDHLDERSRGLLTATIEFFEQKGKTRLKEDDRERVWYQDFLDFQAREKLFATALTPSKYGGEGCRWDTRRICDVNEVLAFYGLHYWYTWQVTMLGLGPLWMSANEAQKRRAAEFLDAGEVFAYGLSERAHGADIYSTETRLHPVEGGSWAARGAKYYIGNGNVAPMVSVFGKVATGGEDEYVFFVADSRHERFHCLRNVVNAQSYVAELELDDYPVAEEDILSQGSEAWDASLNTVNIGKYNLGWASIGICTHALYEAVQHAHARRLYKMQVTDFPHVRRGLTEAYARLVAMKLVALRASDYMRVASPEDRRYLLYNPLVKMRVTTEGERVIDLLWEVIAARGFESDMFFEMAARDIRALPKLEGTVHVNVALISKFVANYFFRPTEYPPVPPQVEARDDTFLFRQGPTRGLSKIQFQDLSLAFESRESPNLAVFREQVGALAEMLMGAAPTKEQARDPGLMLAAGQLFATVVYAELVLEAAPQHGIGDELLDQIFDGLIQDMAAGALALHQQPSASEEQRTRCLGMIRHPVGDEARSQRVWEREVVPLAEGYRMRE